MKKIINLGIIAIFAGGLTTACSTPHIGLEGMTPKYPDPDHIYCSEWYIASFGPICLLVNN